MITLTNLNDVHKNYCLTGSHIRKEADEGKMWVVHLVTSALPIWFINNDNRIVDISILPLHEIDKDKDSIIYIPVTEKYFSNIGDTYQFFYRSFPNKQNLPLNSSAFCEVDVAVPKNSDIDINSMINEFHLEPQICIELKVTQDSSNENQEKM